VDCLFFRERKADRIGIRLFHGSYFLATDILLHGQALNCFPAQFALHLC
jgi:hypothetical protein